MSETKKIIPKRRFKEFQNAEEWEQHNISDLVDICSGRDYKHLTQGDIPVYGTGGYMLSVNEALSYKNDAIGIGRKGTIDKPYILKAPFWTVDTLFYGVPKDFNNIDFIFGVFQNVDWRKKDESSGVPSLSKTAINNTRIFVPEVKEQIKIGRCLTDLDNLITLQQRKLEKIKSMKKSYLYEMFPAEGESKPKRRFKGFTDDWENCKLEDISEIIGGGTPSTTNNDYWDGNIDWYSPAEIDDEQIYVSGSKRKITELGLKNSSAKILPAGKTILFTSRAGIGKTAILSQPGATNQGFQSLILKDEYSTYFIYSMSNQIKEKAEAIASGSTFLEISGKMLGKIEIMIPERGEQDVIAQLFEKIDKLININQHKLYKLKNLKKAYLNEMFI